MNTPWRINEKGESYCDSCGKQYEFGTCRQQHYETCAWMHAFLNQSEQPEATNFSKATGRQFLKG